MSGENTGTGADNRLWGPSIWIGANYIAFAYPEKPSGEDKQNIVNYFQSLSRVLPCAKCRTHFQQLLKDFPVEQHTDSRETLTKWLVEAHNRVNDRLQKPRLSYDFVKSQYDFLQSSMCHGVAEQCPSQSPPPTAECATDQGNRHQMAWCLGMLLVGVLMIIAAVTLTKRQRK